MLVLGLRACTDLRPRARSKHYFKAHIHALKVAYGCSSSEVLTRIVSNTLSAGLRLMYGFWESVHFRAECLIPTRFVGSSTIVRYVCDDSSCKIMATVSESDNARKRAFQAPSTCSR